MISCKYALRNSRGYYAGAGNTVRIDFNDGGHYLGIIHSILYASIIVFENGEKISIKDIKDFTLV